MLPKINISSFILSKKYSAVLLKFKLETKFTKYVPIHSCYHPSKNDLMLGKKKKVFSGQCFCFLL